MKNLITTTLFLLCLIPCFWSQAPQAIKYQSVIRSTEGLPLVQTNVGLRLTILEDGSDVYQETWDINTNDFGMVNLEIGQGNTTDDFSTISWSEDDYSLQIELDDSGGSNYELMGTSSLLSVPFALRAESAATADNVDDADSDPSNELQTLSLSGNTLSLSDGNSVTLPSSGGSTNETSKAWARVEATGAINVNFDAHNVISVSHPNTGVYVLQLPPGLFGIATNPAIVASVINQVAGGVAIATYSGSPSAVTVRTYDMSGNLSNQAFSIIAFGIE